MCYEAFFFYLNVLISTEATPNNERINIENKFVKKWNFLMYF